MLLLCTIYFHSAGEEILFWASSDWWFFSSKSLNCTVRVRRPFGIREFSFSRKTCCCIVSISAWFLSTMPSRIHVLWARFIHHIRRFPNLSNFIVHYGLEKEGYFRFFWIMIKLFLFMGSPALYVEILVLQHITQNDKNEKIVQ